MSDRSAGTEAPITWQGRRARAFVPALLTDRDLELGTATVARTVAAEAAVAAGAATLPDEHSTLARLMLRAEGLASSFIEGVAAPVVDVVLAEHHAGPAGSPAAWVAANLDAVMQAVDDADHGPLTIERLCTWHRTLMTGSPTPARHVGVVRDEQGWIGGSSPLDANLVTPPPSEVPRLLDDLVAYANRDDVDAVAQAAVAHAQFEIIHPFADGNGRVGRVLVSWLLTRRLALVTPPPVSIRIAADVGGYASGLTLFRLGQHEEWIRWFADAVAGAGRAQSELATEIARLQSSWRERLRSLKPGGRALRSNSSSWALLDLVPTHVVLTADVVAAELGLSVKGAHAGLRRLVEAGVLVEHGRAPSSGAGQPRILYVSEELLGLVGSNPLR